MRYLRFLVCLLVVATAAALMPHVGRADDAAGAKTFVVGGAFQLTSPENWISREPRTRIVEHEFAVPKAAGDDADGRVTVMGAGGGVAANIDRWYQQFTQPDGAGTKERAKVEKKEIAGQAVTIVDISGTYMDRPGPMAPGVERPHYRMLGAIIETKHNGNHFIKFYGPEKTVAANVDAFNKLLDSLRQK
ncbi:MAG TPA: hypothetical protein VHD36_00355 [Pirellulales bacterium]|nr:hypothetical protein [Pirellulales bacterium]